MIKDQQPQPAGMPPTANCLELQGNFSWGFTSTAKKDKEKAEKDEKEKGKKEDAKVEDEAAEKDEKNEKKKL